MAPATESAEARRAARLCAALSLLAVAALGMYQIGWGERFAGHGIGKGDSRLYLPITQDFPGLVFGRQLDSYRLQRILPSGVIYTALSLLGLPRDDAHVVRGFLWLNFFSMLGLLLLWHRIADAARISTAGRWLGCLLFCNFSCLRAPYYSPVLTDYFAAFLSALLLYGYLRERTALVVFTLMVASFTWPALFLGGTFLLIFPRRSLAPDPATRSQRIALAGVAMAGFVVVLLARLRSPLPEIDLNPPAFGWGGVWLHRELLPISLALALVYVGFMAAHLWDRAAFFQPGFYREAAAARSLLTVGALSALVAAVAFGFASGAPAVNDPWFQLQEISAQSVLRPGNAWVAHAVAFGVLTLLLTVVGRRACRAANELGAGFTLFLASVAVLALTAETRQVMHGLAPLTLVAVLAVEDLRFPVWASWTLAGLAFIASKLWFDINSTGFFASNHPFSHPAQNWWMNVGLWMSDAMYWRQGAAALLGLVLVFVAVRRSRPLVPEERARVWPSTRTVLTFPLAACVLTAVVGGIELGARAIMDTRIPPVDSLSVPDAALGWSNVAGASGRPAGALVALNRLGLRGPERDHAKPVGAKRVLLLGGSIVEGFNVEESATLRAGLERALATRSCGSVEVLNGGVAGYAIDQQRTLFEAEGRRYRPDLVVSVVHYQDLRPLLDESEPHPLPQGLRSVRRNLLYWRGSAALRLLSDATFASAPAAHRFLGRWRIVDYDEPPTELWPFSVRDEAKAAAARFDAELVRLAGAVDTAGAQLVIFYAPARFEVAEGEWDALLERYVMSQKLFLPTRLVRKLERVTSPLDLTFVNPLPAFRAGRVGLNGYDPSTGLWNESGYATASSVLAESAAKSLGCGLGPR